MCQLKEEGTSQTGRRRCRLDTGFRLRDIEGWQSNEVCQVLAVSEANQRVLLHRARSKVRAALERYLTAESP